MLYYKLFIPKIKILLHYETEVILIVLEYSENAWICPISSCQQARRGTIWSTNPNSQIINLIIKKETIQYCQ